MLMAAWEEASPKRDLELVNRWYAVFFGMVNRRCFRVFIGFGGFRKGSEAICDGPRSVRHPGFR